MAQNMSHWTKFLSFSKFENISPLNPEILVKKSLLVVEKLHFIWWDILFWATLYVCVIRWNADIHINFHLAKLLVVEEILYGTVFSRSFRVLND